MKKTIDSELKKITQSPPKAATSHAMHIAAMGELKRIYWFEQQLLIAIPILLKSAVTSELVESLTVLMKYTSQHIDSLESQFPEINQVIIKETDANN